MAAAYSASRAEVITMAKSIEKDIAGARILANCVAPAVIETPMLGDMAQGHVDCMSPESRLAAWGRSEEAASPICFLASDERTFSTGACFVTSPAGAPSTDPLTVGRVMLDPWPVA